MKINCRAKRSPNCDHGRECAPIYGEDSMADDGTFDGESVVCTPCYIAGGQPALPVEDVTSRQQIIDHVNREMGLDANDLRTGEVMTAKERISAATTTLTELDLVEMALSIDISLAQRDESSFPRLADETEALVSLLSGFAPLRRLMPWTLAEERRVEAIERRSAREVREP